MRRTMEKLMRRCGMPLLLGRNGEQVPIWGFLQQTGSRSWQNTEMNFSPLGEIPGGNYLYIGPVVPTGVGDTLTGDGKSYVLRRVETVMFRDQPAYIWGLCVEKGGEDTWGT